MNKRRLVVILLLIVAILGFTFSVASAAVGTKTTNIVDGKYSQINIGKGDIVYTAYDSKYSGQSGKSRLLTILGMKNNDKSYSKYHNIIKVKITYKNDKNNKILSKIYKTKSKGFTQVVPKGWTPKKATIMYKTVNPLLKTKTLKVIDGKVKKVNIGKNDYLKLAYSTKPIGITQGTRQILLRIQNIKLAKNYHEITVAKVIFQNDKTKKIVSKLFKPSNNKYLSVISYTVPKGWTPKKVITQYKSLAL